MNKLQEESNRNDFNEIKKNIESNKRPNRKITLIEPVKRPAAGKQLKKNKGTDIQKKIKKINGGYKNHVAENNNGNNDMINELLLNCRQPQIDMKFHLENNNIQNNKENHYIDQNEKITEILQLIENSSEPRIALNEISDDEEIFIFDVPKDAFNNNLIGKKMIISPTSLALGSNVYPVSQAVMSNEFFCVINDNVESQNLCNIESIKAMTLSISPSKSDGKVKKILTFNEFEEKQIISRIDKIQTLETVDSNIDKKSEQEKIKLDKTKNKLTKKKIPLKRACKDSNREMPTIKESSKIETKSNIEKMDDNNISDKTKDKKILQTVKNKNKRAKNESKGNNENKVIDVNKKSKSKKNEKKLSAAVAAEEIKNIIGKVFKIKEDNSNTENSIEGITFQPIDFDSIDNSKRYLSTSSSDDETMAFNTSFKVEETKRKKAPR